VKARRNPADLERLARRDVGSWLTPEDVEHIEHLCDRFDAAARAELTALAPGANRYLTAAFSQGGTAVAKVALSNVVRHRRHEALRAAGFDPWASSASGTPC